MSSIALVFSLVGDYFEADVARMRALVDELEASRKWVLGPPRFIDELDYEACTAPDDEPIRTVGGVLLLNAPSDDLELERAHYSDVLALVTGLVEYSRRLGGDDVEIEVELDGVLVGDIAHGCQSDQLREGLLGEWAQRLAIDQGS